MAFSLFISFASIHADADILGKVTKSSTGEPIGGVRVLLKPILSCELEDPIETITAANGTYQFLNVSSGDPQIKYNVQILPPPGFLPVSPNPVTVSVNEKNVRVNFSIGVVGSIDGYVLDENTRLPVCNASIDIMRGNSIVKSVKTNEEGYYCALDLAPRPYLIRVKMPHFQTDVQLAIVISEVCLPINFELKCPPGKVVGQVVDEENGNPITNAIVEISNNGIALDAVQVNEDGQYKLTEIPSNSYVIKVTAPKYQAAEKEVALLANQTFVSDFSLQAYGSVSGQIRHSLTGNPIAGATLGLWRDNELLDSVLTDENGYYTISGLYSCTLCVQASRFYEEKREVKISSQDSLEMNINLLSVKPPPPRSGSVRKISKKSMHRLKVIHEIKWKPSISRSVVVYLVYRDDEKIAEVLAVDPLIYNDDGQGGRIKNYSIVAVNQLGQKSRPLMIVVEE